MSGYKKSSTTLSRERETKLRILENIKTCKGERSGVKTEIEKILQDTARGIKATFAAEVKKAMSWVESVGKEEWRQDMSTSVAGLQSHLQSLTTQLNHGQELLSVLLSAFHEKAGALEKALLSELAEQKARYVGAKDLLDMWAQEGNIVIRDEIEKSETLLSDQHLSDARSEIGRLGSQLSHIMNQAKELSLKHEKRGYVLKAVRQTAIDLGFEELSAPYYAKENDPRSHIVYRVDTLNQGEITFYLTLDGISTHSRIADEKCHDEFDKLSAHLEQEFGVQTHFRAEDSLPDERRLAKGELDLPDEGAAIEQEMSNS